MKLKTFFQYFCNSKSISKPALFSIHYRIVNFVMDLHPTPFPGKTRPLKQKSNRKATDSSKAIPKEPSISRQKRVFGTTRSTNIPVKTITEQPIIKLPIGVPKKQPKSSQLAPKTTNVAKNITTESSKQNSPEKPKSKSSQLAPKTTHVATNATIESSKQSSPEKPKPKSSQLAPNITNVATNATLESSKQRSPEKSKPKSSQLAPKTTNVPTNAATESSKQSSHEKPKPKSSQLTPKTTHVATNAAIESSKQRSKPKSSQLTPKTTNVPTNATTESSKQSSLEKPKPKSSQLAPTTTNVATNTATESSKQSSPEKPKPKLKKKSVCFKKQSSQNPDNALQEESVIVPKTPVASSSLNKAKIAGTPYHSAENCSNCRFDRLETASYWLGQIRSAETVGKHFVSAAFFSLAFESKAEPIRSLRIELKRYLVRHGYLSAQTEWRDCSLTYGLLKDEKNAQGKNLGIGEAGTSKTTCSDIDQDQKELKEQPLEQLEAKSN